MNLLKINLIIFCTLQEKRISLLFLGQNCYQNNPYFYFFQKHTTKILFVPDKKCIFYAENSLIFYGRKVAG